MGRGRRAIGALATIALLMSGILSIGMPVDAQQDNVTVVARGLTTPGGFTWNANDVLFVALAGSGGSATGPARSSGPGWSLHFWPNWRSRNCRRRLPNRTGHRHHLDPHPTG